MTAHRAGCGPTFRRRRFGGGPARDPAHAGLWAYRPVRSRCVHPGQQHGRRRPPSSSSRVRRMRRCRVAACLASSTQQMNSLRPRGVRSFQVARTVASALSAWRRSAGRSCTTPPGISWISPGSRRRVGDRSAVSRLGGEAAGFFVALIGISLSCRCCRGAGWGQLSGRSAKACFISRYQPSDCFGCRQRPFIASRAS